MAVSPILHASEPAAHCIVNGSITQIRCCLCSCCVLGMLEWLQCFVSCSGAVWAERGCKSRGT